MSASLGLASGRYESGEGVLQDADLAMYAAKANGKARVELFEHTMRTTRRRPHGAGGRRAGRGRGGRDASCTSSRSSTCSTLEVEGHEALVRWQHPQRGLLGPDAFMALAEETGAIVPMGWWVLEQACEQAQTWPGGQIGVNLAARQLLDPAAVTTVAGILTRTGIDPRRVVLEITESVFLDTEAIGHRLHQLRALGVLLAIDDFGTGYSSLSYLTRLPVDIVKIDRSFVERLGGPPGDEVLVRAVVQLARSLGLRSVGEGVETPAQLERLQSFGCDAAQGYLFGRPQAEPRFDLGQPPRRSDGEAPRRRGLTSLVRVSRGGRRRTRLGEVGAADQQVGEPRVALVVAEGAAVEAAHVQPGRRGHRRGRGVVPLVLAAGVGVDVGLAEHHRHGLGAGGAHRHESPAERLLDQPRLERRTGPGHEDPRLAVVRRAGRRAAGRWRG